MTQVVESVYNGRDNTIDLLCTDTGESITHSSITRIVISLNDDPSTIIDSSINADAFEWDNGKVVLSLGHLGLPVGAWDAEFVLYDEVNTSGVVWQPLVGLEITAE